MRKAAKYILQLITFVYIIGILILILPTFLGIQVLAVTSGSMEPSIPVGSVVYAQPAAFEEIQPGDIISFHLEKSGIKVTHRVVEKDEALRTLSTKGDANKDPDAQPTSYKDVDGIVRCAIPYLGRMAIFLNDRLGKLTLMSLFLLLLGMQEMLGQKGEKANCLKEQL